MSHMFVQVKLFLFLFLASFQILLAKVNEIESIRAYETMKDDTKAWQQSQFT